MVQAALGATVTVPTLDGDEELEFPPGTQPGEIKVLRSKGVQRLNGHGHGDQAITVRVIVPRGLDEKHRRLLEDFDEAVGADITPKSPTGCSTSCATSSRADGRTFLPVRAIIAARLRRRERLTSIRVSVPRSLARGGRSHTHGRSGSLRGGAAPVPARHCPEARRGLETKDHPRVHSPPIRWAHPPATELLQLLPDAFASPALCSGGGTGVPAIGRRLAGAFPAGARRRRPCTAPVGAPG